MADRPNAHAGDSTVMAGSTGRLAIVALVLGGASVAVIYGMRAVGEAPPEVQEKGQSVAVETPEPTQAREADLPSPEPRAPVAVEAQEFRVHVGQDRASWIAAFPPEQQAKVRKYADKWSVGLALVVMRDIVVVEQEIAGVSVTLLSDLPELVAWAGDDFPAYLWRDRPFELPAPPDLQVGDVRVALIQSFLMTKAILLCVSGPVRLDAEMEQQLWPSKLIDLLPAEAKGSVEPGTLYSAVVARMRRWRHPVERVAQATEESGLVFVEVEVVTTLFSHRPEEWAPGTVHSVFGGGIDPSSDAEVATVDRLLADGEPKLLLVDHGGLRPELVWMGVPP